MSRSQNRVVGPKHLIISLDVIQRRGFAVFEERYGVFKVSDGERCQHGFMSIGF